MTEIIFLVAIIGLISLVAFIEWNNRKERSKLINAILAKDNQEMVNLELADKTKIETTPDPQPDFMDQSVLDDEEWAEMEGIEINNSKEK